MKIEELKQGQTVWVKGYVDSSVFGGCWWILLISIIKMGIIVAIFQEIMSVK